MASRDELLLECRQWMQSALEELTLCPTAHTRPSLRGGDELIEQVDAALRSGLVVVAGAKFDVTPSTRADDHGARRLHEVEAALVAVAKAFTSLDALVRAAKVIEAAK
jgi:hypothetical protein